MTGSIGELMAQTLFSKIGWAPPVKLSQDIGTDLVTFARDNAAPDEKENAWDLGAPVFMQVKSSPTEYLLPASRYRHEAGWWFDESDTYHFDHWLSFGLPYLLVLVDTTHEVAYWVEVSGEAIIATGKGRKIFVPSTQTVDEKNSERLTEVAVARRQFTLEGSVWRGRLNDLAPADRLRTALVLPRLVAPHGNRAVDAIGFEQGVALVLKNRAGELALRSRQGQCPRVEDWEGHKEWGWRFLHALLYLTTGGGSSQFEKLATEARHRFERDACLVISACGAYVSGQTQDALDALTPSRATKPSDRGWILVHKSAFMFELDRTTAAVDSAKKALVATKALAGDLSASAIRGAAAAILYGVAGWGSGDIEETITAQDHAANWWRTQDVSWALEKHLTSHFEAWASTNRMHFGGSRARDDLNTVAWTAALSGDWNSWRHLTSTKAKLTLTSTTDPKLVSGALEDLVFIGDKDAAKDVAHRIWLDGPAETLVSLVSKLAVGEWSPRSEAATLAVLAEAGDMLDRRSADLVTERILDLVGHAGVVRRHGASWSHRWSEAAPALARVLLSASAKSHRRVAELIAADFATCGQGTAEYYVRLASHLSLTSLNASSIKRLQRAAAARPDHLRLSMLEILGRVSQEAVAGLRLEAEQGNPHAYRSLLVAGSTDQEDYIAFGKRAAETVKIMISDARGLNGSVSMSGYANDPLDDLVLAALNTRSGPLWKDVTDALEACVIDETQQQRAIRRLAMQFPSLPPAVQRKLRRLAPKLRGSSIGGFLTGPNDFAAACVHLRIATGSVPDDAVETLLLSQRRSDPVGFARTLTAWTSARKLPFLSTMVVDDNPTIRAEAGYSLVEHISRFPDDGTRALAVIRSALLQEAGCALPDGIAQGLAQCPNSMLRDVEKALRRHPSGAVRTRFADGL